MRVSKEAQEAIRRNRELYDAFPDWRKMDYTERRKIFDERGAAKPTAEGARISRAKMGGIPVERVTVTDAGEKVILYIHGGGMTMGSSVTGRFMLSNVAKLSGRNAVSADYRLSPEYAQPAALEDCFHVYEALLEEGHRPEDIALLGESAGGMLVLSLLAYLGVNNHPMPGCACAISGSVDCEYHSQSMERNRDTEIIVNLNLCEMMREIYYGDCDPKDPVLSPIYADVSGWPPVYFHVCKEEILEDESIRMYVKLQEAGVEAELSVTEGLFHTYMMLDLPESYDAFEQIAAFFKKH